MRRMKQDKDTNNDIEEEIDEFCGAAEVHKALDNKEIAEPNIEVSNS